MGPRMGKFQWFQRRWSVAFKICVPYFHLMLPLFFQHNNEEQVTDGEDGRFCSIFSKGVGDIGKYDVEKQSLIEMQYVNMCLQRATSSVRPMRCGYSMEVRSSPRATGPAHRLGSRLPRGHCKSLLTRLAERSFWKWIRRISPILSLPQASSSRSSESTKEHLITRRWGEGQFRTPTTQGTTFARRFTSQERASWLEGTCSKRRKR